MKRTTLFLSTLASASLAVVLPSVSGEKQQTAEVKPDRELLTKFHTTVQNQVLQHLNPKESLADRFSRRIVPMQYYHSEIVSTSKEGVIEFKIIHWDRAVRPKPAKETFAIGRFVGSSSELFLFDRASGKYVPAVEHPAIRKGGAS